MFEEKGVYAYTLIVNFNKNFKKIDKKIWSSRGSIPGPYTCKAYALPLSYYPLLIII